PSRAGSSGSGFFVWMTSVAASGASILSTVVKTVLTRILALGSYVRSMLNLASAELKGSPLCHLTPWRSLNTHVVWPWSFHSIARPGASLPSGRRLVRLSKRLNEMRMSFDDVLMCGSNWATSPGGAGGRDHAARLRLPSVAGRHRGASRPRTTRRERVSPTLTPRRRPARRGLAGGGKGEG